MILGPDGKPIDVEPCPQDSLSDWERRRVEYWAKYWAEWAKRHPWRIVVS